MKRAAILLLWLVVLVECLSAQNMPSPYFRLLTPTTGWAATTRQIFWTTDAGATWADITPYAPSCILTADCAPGAPSTIGPVYEVSAVFFLDTSIGWALLASFSGNDNSDDNKLRFDVASTNNAGKNWVIHKVAISTEDRQFGFKAWLDFADAKHGWVNCDVASSAAFNPGFLLATEDGGKTWHQPQAAPGTAGPIRFVTAKQGWLAGTFGELFATWDGSNTWQAVILKAPPQVYPAVYPSHSLPLFRDRRRGFLPVVFSGGDGVRSSLVVFSTENSGKTWKPTALLPLGSDTVVGQGQHFELLDSVLLTPSLNMLPLDDQAPTIRTEDGAEGLAWDGLTPIDFSFISKTQGWISTRFGGFLLWSTTDAGRTWIEITPPLGRRSSEK